MKKATIRISNLALRTIIGANEWEREKKQEIIINIVLKFDASEAVATDSLKKTINYKKIKRRVTEVVEASQFFLLEKLTSSIIDVIMEDDRVLKTRVKVDKPHALRFADSVSVEMEAVREG
ncbi:MAG: FolB domain-containing protein [Chitinivibrionales bacterium]|nr:FolB domain-containing protein [Chitinivibrionales bacterium]